MPRYVWILLILAYARTSSGQGHAVPPDFNQICFVQPAEGPTQVHCQLSRNDTQRWRVDTLRAWVMTPKNNQTNIRYSYTITCDESGGVVSLPWPVKCPGLLELSISNCNITDTHKDVANDLITTIPDHLIKLHQFNSKTVQSYVDFLSIVDTVDTFDSRYGCLHPSTIQEIVNRNTSYAFTGTLEEGLAVLLQECLNNTALDLFQVGAQDGADFDYSALSCTPEELKTRLQEIPKKLRSINLRCNYEQLKLLDESISTTLSRYSVHFLGQYHSFPKLQVVNYSSTFMDELPQEFRDWTFTFDSLTTMDISHNLIKTFDLKQPFGKFITQKLYINLRYNNITTLTLADLNKFSAQDKAFIDIRNNPIVCDCELKVFLRAVSDASVFTGALQDYGYLRNMTCASPELLRGMALMYVTEDMLNCPVDLVPYFIALAFVATFILILIIMSFVYRREIRIILVMRFHILIPSTMSLTLGDKTYHAFVSYANDDEDWVLDVLCKQLEQPDKEHALDKSTSRLRTQQKKTLNQFKLCLHQRDFIPGIPIIENIIHSINNSNHTIIVVSKNFIKSSWSMEEFYLAYKQSIDEKRRHLIIVILEDVSEEANLDARLKRCMKTFTYLKASDRLFYDRLAYSLSVDDKMTKEEKQKLSQNSELFKNGSSDRINPASSTCSDSCNSVYTVVSETSPEDVRVDSVQL